MQEKQKPLENMEGQQIVADFLNLRKLIRIP